MGTRILQSSFLGGELSPAFLGRIEHDLYGAGAQKIENFIVEPQGSLITRPGFQFVCESKDTKPVRLIPFRYSSDQTFVLVFGDRWLRFVTYGKLVTKDDGSIYEIKTPYASNDLFDLDYCQNADIITITNNNYAPQELRRYGNTDWRFEAVKTSAQINPPSSLTLTAAYPNGTNDNDKGIITARYVVTAIDSKGVESVASQAYSVKCNYYITGAPVTVSWTSVTGAEYYNVYREVSGIFGFLGQTSDTSLVDEGDNPDTTITPPRYSEPFSGAQGAILSIDVLDGGTGYFPQTSGGMSLPKNLRLNTTGWWCEYCGGMLISSDDMSDASTMPHNEVQLLIYDGSQHVYTCPIDGYAKAGWYQEFKVGQATTTKLYVIRCPNASPSGRTLDLTPVTHKFKNEIRLKLNFVDKADYIMTQSWWMATTGVSLDELLKNESFKTNYETYQNFTPEQKDLFNRFTTSTISLNEFLQLSPQDLGLYEVPLTITDSTGKGAHATALATGGVITSVRMNAAGTNYTAPSVTANSETGRNAKFKAKIAGQNQWEYPAAITQYDQRRIFAGSYQSPLKVWMTNAGQQDLMMYHLPVMDDDRIEVEAVTADADRIKHAVALDGLILFTGSSELRVFTQNSDALAPDSVAVRTQSYIGANNCQPVISGSTIIYAANRGGHIRGMSFSYASNGYTSSDTSLAASHLFDGYTIKDITLMKAPYNIVWCVSSSGKLLGMTFYPEHNEQAWHQHSTDGVFESVCCISEGEEDRLYAVIRRTLNGQSKRYIERMSKIKFTTNFAVRQLDSFIDNQTEISSLATTTQLTGLEHLEGKTVVPFVNGNPKSAIMVKNGKVTIEGTGSNIAIGLPYSSRLITVPLTAAVQGSLQGTVKNISEIFLRISNTGDIFANIYPSERLRPIKTDAAEMLPQEDGIKIVKVTTDGRWDYQGQIEIEHRNALPLQLHAIVGNVTVEKGS